MEAGHSALLGPPHVSLWREGKVDVATDDKERNCRSFPHHKIHKKFYGIRATLQSVFHICGAYIDQVDKTHQCSEPSVFVILLCMNHT
ncbi:hypothetical protein CYMTET_14570 [Cymbomonas tetramitiformis]|uniref:Uncharacterized protein n=1 Tax=Cymbomonas tetramitiformis TaxID=36881 RepID=A0AAE0GFU1_9CHLO|nr:hypothetical protein CYMTET_14570 [Cymbomonas tetramitiformis]